MSDCPPGCRVNFNILNYLFLHRFPVFFSFSFRSLFCGVGKRIEMSLESRKSLLSFGCECNQRTAFAPSCNRSLYTQTRKTTRSGERFLSLMKGRRQTYYIAARHVEYPNFGRKNSGVLIIGFFPFLQIPLLARSPNFFGLLFLLFLFPFCKIPRETAWLSASTHQFRSHISPPCPPPLLDVIMIPLRFPQPTTSF